MVLQWRNQVFQKWYLFKCINLFIYFLFISSVLADTLPKLFQEVEKKYSRSSSLSAYFEQTNYNVTTLQTEKSSGHLFFKKPCKMRWETKYPFPQLLVSNGSIFWFYTPPFEPGENGQVIQKTTETIYTTLIKTLLSGSFLEVPDMNVQSHSPYSITLTPQKKNLGEITHLTFFLDKKITLIQKVIIRHKSGNKSEILLSKIQLNPPLDDQIFNFVVPKNTDIIR